MSLTINPMQYANILPSMSLTTTGATQIFTTPATVNNFMCTTLIVHLLSISGFVSVATISLGTNSTSYNNILSALPLTGLSVLGNILQIPLTTTSIAIAPSTPVYINVGIGAIASSMSAKVILLGFNV